MTVLTYITLTINSTGRDLLGLEHAAYERCLLPAVNLPYVGICIYELDLKVYGSLEKPVFL